MKNFFCVLLFGAMVNQLLAQNLFTPNGILETSNNGYIGIGTNSPSTNFHVLGNNWAGLRLESTASNTDPVLFLKSKGGEWAIQNDDSQSNELEIKFDEDPKLTLEPNGYLGLGTGNPNTNLHIQRHGWAGLRLESTASNTDPVLFLKSKGGEWAIQNDDSQSNELEIKFDEDPKLTLESNGYLGLGTGNPNTNLHIQRHGWAGLRLESTASNTDPVLFLKSKGGEWAIQNDDSQSNELEIKFDEDPKLTLESNGYLGLGTGNPNTNLHIQRNGWAGLRLESTALDTDPVLFLKSVGGEWALQNDDSGNNELEFRYEGQTKFQLDKDGSLSLGGTFIPNGYKLAVDGKVICEELKVQLSENWPDYVFSEDYDLKPLSEVKAFIEEHKHLPNMPSAEEIVAQDGFEMGEMQRRMMEKIEELTLHMIQLDEKNAELEKQNAQLVNEIEGLQSKK